MYADIQPFCRIDRISSYYDFRATMDVLRLDLLHPVISGNKWFKLKLYLAEAKAQQKVLLTFGGAFSNHLVATAAATENQGLKSLGIVRGEKPKVLSHTLQQAKSFGMELHFISREAYKKKQIPETVYRSYMREELYVVPEGGYGEKGAEGAKDILMKNKTAFYTHILCAVGTGTTLAGIIAAAKANQQVIGISALKNHFSLEEEIRSLLPPEKKNQFTLLHDYHFGGYANHTNELRNFMNRLYTDTSIPTDFVYTAKAFYAAFDLMNNGYFTATDKILLLHTGGLQGNLSLPKGTLIFG